LAPGTVDRVYLAARRDKDQQEKEMN